MATNRVVPTLNKVARVFDSAQPERRIRYKLKKIHPNAFAFQRREIQYYQYAPR